MQARLWSVFEGGMKVDLCCACVLGCMWGLFVLCGWACLGGCGASVCLVRAKPVREMTKKSCCVLPARAWMDGVALLLLLSSFCIPLYALSLLSQRSSASVFPLHPHCRASSRPCLASQPFFFGRLAAPFYAHHPTTPPPTHHPHHGDDQGLRYAVSVWLGVGWWGGHNWFVFVHTNTGSQYLAGYTRTRRCPSPQHESALSSLSACV
jgi:hypothetical protein